MTKWVAIHPAVEISGSDGFHMLCFEMPSYSAMDAISSKLITDKKNPYDDFVRRLIPDGPVPRNPKDALKMYLSRTASSTFCVGNANRFTSTDEDTSTFLAGFRSKKDIFKMLLTWPDAEESATWRTSTQFFVRVAEGDEFIPTQNVWGKVKEGEVL